MGKLKVLLKINIKENMKFKEFQRKKNMKFKKLNKYMKNLKLNQKTFNFP